MRVVLAREPLSDERIATLTDVERDRLAALRRATRFGESLGLAPSSSYRHLLDQGDDQGLHVVVAAPPDRLEPVTWWFPITGRVAYRSYFDAERAGRFAASLDDRGYDTYVRRASLYSTLGWFDDPVPRGMLSWNEVSVVDVILHELVHSTIFAADQSDYNEAIASFVASEATLRFYAESPEELEAARRSYADRRRFASLLDALSADLEQVYARAQGPDQARGERELVFERYRLEVYPSRDWETGHFDGFLEAPLSNAYLVAQATYLAELACFDAWLRALDGDLERFITLHHEQPGAWRDDLAECGTR